MTRCISFLILSIALCCCSLVLAQDRPDTQGEIELESYAVEVGSATELRKRTLTFLKEVSTQMHLLAQGKPAEIPSMPNIEEGNSSNFTLTALTHLSVAHLRCSVSEGICLPVIDTLLEMDLINSKLKGQVACPNLQRGWKLWIDNDMEKRLQHQVQIGFFKGNEKFKREIRPAYVKCKETIAALLNGNTESAPEFFKKRYAEHPEKLAAPGLTIKIMEALEKSDSSAFDLNL